MFSRFLVVGGAGFVGSHLVDLLFRHCAVKVGVLDSFFLGSMENLSWAIENGNVVVHKEDARHLTAVENIIEREKPEVVFNMSVKPLLYSFIDPEGAYMTSVEIAHNLAHTLREGMYSRLLHFSSSEVYGTATHLVPMSEQHPLNPTTPYGAGKAAADLLLLSYHNLFNLDLSIIRPFNMYGSRQNIGAYAAVIPVTIKRILNGEKPVIEGDGEQSRDFTYVGDVVDASLKLLECDEAVGKVVNVGQEKEVSIKKIVSLVCDILDYPFEDVQHADERPGDVRRHIANINLAWNLIKYHPKTSLEEGLKHTINWYKKCQ